MTISKHPENSHQYKLAKRIIILLCVVALGPYVISQAGVRLEHFVIYFSLLYVFLASLTSHKNILLNRFAASILGLFFASVIWIFAVSYLYKGLGNIYGLLAALENFIQPITLILVLSWFLARLDRTARFNLLRVAIITMIVMLCINALVAIASVYFDTWPVVRYFVLSDTGIGGRGSVFERAASMGRFSGVFNQPFESGVAYSIGLLGWIYLAVTARRITLNNWVALTLLLAGGALSVSKVFILGGFPLAILFWCWLSMGRLSVRKSTLFGGTLWILVATAALSALAASWAGLRFFLRLFDFACLSEHGIINVFTAGRFGQETTGVKSLFIQTWSESPIFGFGAPIDGALDNAYIEFFYYGGSVALLLNILMLLVVFYVAFLALQNAPKLGKFLFVLWVFIIGAGMGAPILTLNRSSIYLWVILVIAFGLVSKRKQRKCPEADVSFAGSCAKYPAYKPELT